MPALLPPRCTLVVGPASASHVMVMVCKSLLFASLERSTRRAHASPHYCMGLRSSQPCGTKCSWSPSATVVAFLNIFRSLELFG